MWRHNTTIGLSLPEMLVVLAGLLLLLSLTFNPLLRTLEFYRLETATHRLAASLEWARHSAIARNEEAVAAFHVEAGDYEIFMDSNSNRTLDPAELLVTRQRLPEGVSFDGTGLWGPPSSPSDSINDPVSFPFHQVVFNPQGKLVGGIGTIYLQNRMAEARALSFNMAGRLKIYAWQKKSTTWK